MHQNLRSGLNPARDINSIGGEPRGKSRAWHTSDAKTAARSRLHDFETASLIPELHHSLQLPLSVVHASTISYYGFGIPLTPEPSPLCRCPSGHGVTSTARATPTNFPKCGDFYRPVFLTDFSGGGTLVLPHGGTGKDHSPVHVANSLTVAGNFRHPRQL